MYYFYGWILLLLGIFFNQLICSIVYNSQVIHSVLSWKINLFEFDVCICYARVFLATQQYWNKKQIILVGQECPKAKTKLKQLVYMWTKTKCLTLSLSFTFSWNSKQFLLKILFFPSRWIISVSCQKKRERENFIVSYNIEAMFDMNLIKIYSWPVYCCY